MSTSATPGKSAYTLLYTLGTVSLLFCAGFMIRIAWYILAGTVSSLELSTCGLPHIRTAWLDFHCRYRNFLLA